MMDNLLTKTEKLKQQKLACLRETKGIGRAFKCVPIYVREVFCSIRYLPHFIKNIPYRGFSSLSERNENGTYQVSYSNYLKYKKLSLAIVTILLIIFGLGTSFFVFNVNPEKVTAAGGGGSCPDPYETYRTSPASNLTLCVNETFVLAGYWTEWGGIAGCTAKSALYGLSNGAIVPTSGAGLTSTTTAHMVSSMQGVTSSRTVRANTAGSYIVRMQSINGDTSAEYNSSAKTVTVKNQPTGPTGSHSANTTSSITWSWNNVSDEDGYEVHNASHTDLSGGLAADTTSWEQTSLDANTQYTNHPHAYATVDSGNCKNDGSAASVYTSIESPSSISFDSVGQAAITVSGAGTITNLSTGGSGIKFTESISATDSGWLQTNSWKKTSLTANKQYTFDAQTRNGDQDTNAAIASENKYTLAADASVSSDVTENVLTNQDEITFTNDASFGEGGVEHYRYVFDQNASHTFDNTETQWSSSTKTLTATADGNWYLHAKAYNGDDVAGSTNETTTLGPFKIDTTAATVSNIQTSSTTSGATITWMTNEATTTQLAWGLTSAYGYTTTEDTTLTTSHSVTLTGLSAGTTYHFKPLAKDSVDNESTVSDQAFATSALEATVITNVRATALSETSVKITWTTNHAADSKVRYGATTTYGKEVYKGALVTSHSITLTGLMAGATYHYEVLSTGNTTTYDADATFTTEDQEEKKIKIPQKDPKTIVRVDPPTVVSSEVSPIEDGAVINDVSPIITGVAKSDNTVFIYIDGVLEETVQSEEHESGNGSFAYKLKRILPPGEHTLYTISRDPEGNFSEASTPITFTVEHPFVAPTLFTPRFTDGSDPEVIFQGVAYNNSVIKVYVDGEYIDEFVVTNNETDNTTSFDYTLSLSEIEKNGHQVTMIAYGPEGKYSKTSNAVTFTKATVTAKPANESYQFDGEINYQVVSGDSLWKIAERFYGDGNMYTKIVQANKGTYPGLTTNPSVIQANWNLTIP